MKIIDWHIEAMNKLRNAGVDSPRRDTLVFLEDLLGKDRAWVTAHPEHKLTQQQIKKLDSLVEKRSDRKPLAYIRGKAWFYGRFFNVNKRVMIPRPESESFIEILKEIKPKRVVDIGTGSGCLAITAKVELPTAKVIAVDNSQNALDVATQNAKKHKVNIRFLSGSLLGPLLSTDYHLPTTTILANLPYVPEGLITSPEITYEPAEALFSGEDGLDHYRKFWQQIAKLSQFPEYVLTESLENQHKELEKLAQKASYKLVKTEGLVQIFKIKP